MNKLFLKCIIVIMLMPIMLLAQEANIKNDVFWNTTIGSSI